MAAAAGLVAANSAGKGGASGSSTGPRGRVSEEGDQGAISAPEPVFSGPGLLPIPTVQGKKKMVRYEGEHWPPGPEGDEPWPIGSGKEDELSFAGLEGWVDLGLDGARLGWVSGPKSSKIGPTTG
ncbi:unnamed protein product [Linum trigynum]|uniref:Chlorophyll a-b binding protein, chloroplastic n=1 Tax=Linum trigynum TaxID=586398 RepID=A0AAV2C9A2_9ROSI